MALDEVFKPVDSLNFIDESHNTYILKRISRMRIHSVLTDVILVVEGKEFPAHRNVLAANSDYFMAMFSGHMATMSDKVEVNEITATAIEILLDFIYKGEILITEENVEDVFCGSCLLLLESVTQACCKFIQDRLTISNCWGIRALSDKFNCNELLQRANTFIEENFMEAASCDEFLILPPSHLEEILMNDEIVIPREEDLYELLLKWVEHNREERVKHFPSLLEKIRLPQINPEYFEEIIATDDLVIEHPEVHDVVTKARKHIYSMMDLEELMAESEPYKWQIPRRCLRTVSVLLTIAGPSCAIFDLETEVWHNISKLSTRHCPGIEALGKYVYVVGGSKEWKRMNTCERYDPDYNQWNVMQPMNVPRSNIGLVALNGYLYAVGGYDGRSPIRTVECYDPMEDEWKFVASMNNQRDGACVVTEGRYIYVISGYDGHSYLSSVEMYDPSTDAWVLGAVAPIIERREDAMAAVVENKIYVIGGYHGNTFMPTCEALDLDKNEWNFMASLSSPRYQAGVAVLNRKIYVCGGWSGNGLATALVECYDVATDTWSMVMPLPTPAAARTAFINFPRKMIEKLRKEITKTGSEEQLAQPTKKDSVGADHRLYGATI